MTTQRSLLRSTTGSEAAGAWRRIRRRNDDSGHRKVGTLVDLFDAKTKNLVARIPSDTLSDKSDKTSEPRQRRAKMFDRFLKAWIRPAFSA
jgi:hypothetical protein